MRIGICAAVEQGQAVKSAGGDFIEGSVQALMAAQIPDGQWQGKAQVAAALLPVPAANLLIPASLKIVGPEARRDLIEAYMSTVLRRAAQTETRMLVFGSGGARNVPAGFDRERARAQIDEFLRIVAPLAQQNGITIVIEHLNRGECNIINTVAEAMTYVRAADHPNIQCLVDTYHLWLEREPLENVEAAMPWIKHVHVGDERGRTPPGESGRSDYGPIFSVLKSAGYDGMISIEAANFTDPVVMATVGKRSVAFLRDQWEQA